jgi:short-subunit dehydrogenase
MKPIHEQTLVITGASSGIGLATARMAAERGARVVLSARDDQTLGAVTEDLVKRGARATFLATDVADYTGVKRLAEHAFASFGRIDSWVNNAGTGVFGGADELPLEDMRRIFETNYWGVVHGSLVALPYLEQSRGTLINVGSIESDISMPLQATYAASKHAVKGFSDALRMELMSKHSPVQLTLIKPAAIDTPFFQHAKNLTDADFRPPPPVYAPERVAAAILKAAVAPRREVVVGAAGVGMIALQRVAPGLVDWIAARAMTRQQKGGPKREGSSRPGWGGQVHGGHRTSA